MATNVLLTYFVGRVVNSSSPSGRHDHHDPFSRDRWPRQNVVIESLARKPVRAARSFVSLISKHIVDQPRLYTVVAASPWGPPN